MEVYIDINLIYLTFLCINLSIRSYLSVLDHEKRFKEQLLKTSQQLRYLKML